MSLEFGAYRALKLYQSGRRQEALAVLSALPRPARDEAIQAWIRDPRVDPADLAPLVARHWREDPELGPLLAAAVEGRLDAVLEEPGAWGIVAHPRLLAVLAVTVIPDPEAEALVAGLRRALLFAALTGGGRHPGLATPALASVLARNAFLTGYVHPQPPEELEALERLLAPLDGRPLGADPLDPVRVALVAAYRPLHGWDRADEAEEMAAASGSAPLVRLVKQQILDPAFESGVEEEIPALPVGDRRGTSPDGTSGRVRAHYESHPYPHWVRAPRPRPGTLRAYLESSLPGAAFPELEGVAAPRVLVAGCGTGHHPLTLRLRLADATVTAVDVSRASLAMAARKGVEMGVSGVAFLHGDILDMEGWDATFDLVESVGVLQHMAEPLEGWRILLTRLRPGGVMRLGLYAREGREEGEAARRFLRSAGFGGGSPGELREARRAVTAFLRDRPGGGRILAHPDFYNLDALRDLLLHPVEHAVTKAWIRQGAAALGVELLGFEGGSAEPLRGLHRFWLRKPA